MGDNSGCEHCLTSQEPFISTNQTKERCQPSSLTELLLFNSFTALSHLMVFALSHFKADSAIHNAAHIFQQTMHLFWELSPILEFHLDWTALKTENHKNVCPCLIWGARLVSRLFNIQKVFQGFFLHFFLLLSQDIQVICRYCNQLSYRHTFKDPHYLQI